MKATKIKPPSKKLPFVSMILPIRNESAFIARSIKAVLAQDYPRDRYEVVVADGMSTDDTRQIVELFQSKQPNLRLIDNPGRIVPTGLNAAIAQARGQIIARVDGHCEIAPDYLRNCVTHLLNDGVDGVGGPLETIGETFTARVIAAAMSSTFGVGNSAFRTVNDSTQLTDTVAFPAYTRAIVEAAGSFDEELVRNQDDEYNYRLRKLGARILLAADVRSKYYSRGSLRSLWRQYFQYGYWKVRVMQKHPRQMRARQFVPFFFVVSLLLCLLLLPFFGPSLLLVVIGSYFIANLLASILVASRKGKRLFVLLPTAFAILHLSFGLGFLIGLVKFRSRWFNRSGNSTKSTLQTELRLPQV
jgi:glycosyltransferase involved in cell wall biosynthesis